MRKGLLFYGIVLFQLLINPCVYAKQPSFIDLPSTIVAWDDLSAVAKWSSLLIIASDESDHNGYNVIQILQEKAQGHYEVVRDIILFQGDDEKGQEMDIEGMAVENNTIFITGSHSLVRPKIKANKRYKNNRKRLQEKRIKYQPNRYWLYRLRMSPLTHKVSKKDRISLRDLLANDDVLGLFSSIPSKENGIDIEGLATKSGWLYLGFRGPILRNNYVPIMRFQFDQPQASYSLLYVQLGGRGIRGMVAVSDGFLLLAGAVGDGESTYQLYHWNGNDMIIGKDQIDDRMGQVVLLETITPPRGGKAEGVALLREKQTAYELMFVYDGAQHNKIMQQRLVSKP